MVNLDIRIRRALLRCEIIHHAWSALKLFEAVLRIDHREDILYVFAKALVDLDLLLKLLDYNGVLLLEFLVFFAFLLEFAFSDGLGPI